MAKSKPSKMCFVNIVMLIMSDVKNFQSINDPVTTPKSVTVKF
jgi:hypothetical protein